MAAPQNLESLLDGLNRVEPTPAHDASVKQAINRLFTLDAYGRLDEASRGAGGAAQQSAARAQQGLVEHYGPRFEQDYAQYQAVQRQMEKDAPEQDGPTV